jgi:hypothetical protein
MAWVSKGFAKTTSFQLAPLCGGTVEWRWRTHALAGLKHQHLMLFAEFLREESRVGERAQTVLQEDPGVETQQGGGGPYLSLISLYKRGRHVVVRAHNHNGQLLRKPDVCAHEHKARGQLFVQVAVTRAGGHTLPAHIFEPQMEVCEGIDVVGRIEEHNSIHPPIG